MPRPPRGNVAELIQTLFVVGVVGDLTDVELLERFTSDRNGASEAAFRVLIAHHGPMVWRVCRSILTDSHDAQDAFQATFLVLVRKANGLWVRDSLGPWLHRVALRTAKTAHRAAAHRRVTNAPRRSPRSRFMTNRPTTWPGCSLRKSTACRNASARRSFFATSKATPTNTPRVSSIGRWERSRAASPVLGNVSVTASPVGASAQRSHSSPCPLPRPPGSPA